MRAVVTVVALVCLRVTALNGQIYGEWDVPCPLGLSSRFSAPFAHGVVYEGKEFLTPWRSVVQTTPLPSENWCEPVGDPNPLSTDKTSRWYGAKVKGHCTVERTPYYISYHVYPIEYEGNVERCDSSGGGGGGPWYITDPAMEQGYDPYANDAGGTESCSDSGGGEGGSEPVCHDEYIYVEASYDGGVTWEILWEGWAQVCV